MYDHTSTKPSAFVFQTNIKLAISKTHPNKSYVKKQAEILVS